MNIGRYRAGDPLSAARKGFNRYCRTKKINKLCEFFITIKETTRGSSNNLFSYKAVRKLRQRPVVMFPGTQREYMIEHRTNIEPIEVPQACINTLEKNK